MCNIFYDYTYTAANKSVKVALDSAYFVFTCLNSQMHDERERVTRPSILRT